jgi:hypothetical protein
MRLSAISAADRGPSAADSSSRTETTRRVGGELSIGGQAISVVGADRAEIRSAFNRSSPADTKPTQA